MSVIHVIGCPSSAGNFSLGQEKSPAAVRAAGLVDALTSTGNEARDHGDLTRQRWRPDREHPGAQNLRQVVDSIGELADAVPGLRDAEERLLGVGGNCTFALGALAGLRRRGVSPDLVYIDRHFDANTPMSSHEGAFDWMGISHALALMSLTG